MSVHSFDLQLEYIHETYRCTRLHGLASAGRCSSRGQLHLKTQASIVRFSSRFAEENPQAEELHRGFNSQAAQLPYPAATQVPLCRVATARITFVLSNIASVMALPKKMLVYLVYLEWSRGKRYGCG